jgi:hypothetical protein
MKFSFPESRRFWITLTIAYVLFLFGSQALHPWLEKHVFFGGYSIECWADSFTWNLETIVLTPIFCTLLTLIDDKVLRRSLGSSMRELVYFAALMLVLNKMRFSLNELFWGIIWAAGIGIATFYQLKLELTSRWSVIAYAWKKLVL